jgi:hypothetical protein
MIQDVQISAHISLRFWNNSVSYFEPLFATLALKYISKEELQIYNTVRFTVWTSGLWCRVIL